MTKQDIFVGVDGGATKSAIRVEDAAGQLLAQSTGGPANIRLSVSKTWATIMDVLTKLLPGVFDNNRYDIHVGMGLAGCEIQEAYSAFIQQPHQFTTLIVAPDSHTACLGAHGGQDGAVILAGTGVVGLQVQHGEVMQVSGWGFPHDDEGSGAWLGLQAIKSTLQWLDGRGSDSGLSRAIYAHFGSDRTQLVTWANQANSTAFAELAPFVIQQSQKQDVTANYLLQEAARAIEKVNNALTAQSLDGVMLPCVLMGGIAPFLQPYLSEQLRARLRPAQQSAEKGAILLVRQQMMKGKI